MGLTNYGLVSPLCKTSACVVDEMREKFEDFDIDLKASYDFVSVIEDLRTGISDFVKAGNQIDACIVIPESFVLNNDIQKIMKLLGISPKIQYKMVGISHGSIEAIGKAVDIIHTKGYKRVLILTGGIIFQTSLKENICERNIMGFAWSTIMIENQNNALDGYESNYIDKTCKTIETDFNFKEFEKDITYFMSVNNFTNNEIDNIIICGGYGVAAKSVLRSMGRITDSIILLNDKYGDFGVSSVAMAMNLGKKIKSDFGKRVIIINIGYNQEIEIMSWLYGENYISF